MMLLRVQRSGRTRIRATTRSGSASVKVTPFNSANGIFIDWIFSSAVFCGPVMDSPLVFPTIRSENGLAKQLGPSELGPSKSDPSRFDPSKSGNDLRGNGTHSRTYLAR